MGLLNKIYFLVQAGRYLYDIICDKFDQSEAEGRVSRKFDDGEGETVAFVHMDDILTHAQTTMEKLFAELGRKV